MTKVWVKTGGWTNGVQEQEEFGIYETQEGAIEACNQNWGEHRAALVWYQLAPDFWQTEPIDDYRFTVIAWLVQS